MPSRSEWNRAPRDSRTSRSPYQLRSSTDVSRPAGAGWSAARPRSRWCGRRGPGRRPRRPGGANATPSAAATAAATGRRRRGSPEPRVCPPPPAATQHPTMPAPTTLTRSPTSGGASQRALTAVSTVPGQDRPLGRHAVRHRDHGRRRHHVARLVRVEAEHGPSLQRRAGPCSTTPTLRYPYFTGPGKSPSWNGARIRAYWSGGTSPRNTRASVPRLTPDRRARTSTSPSPGSGTVAVRSSPTPGARTQNATASGVTRDLALPGRVMNPDLAVPLPVNRQPLRGVLVGEGSGRVRGPVQSCLLV